MGRKSKWELEQDKIMATRKKAIKGLTETQLLAIKKSHDALYLVTENIKDMEDLYLSDIRDMSEAMWKLKHEFNLGEK